MSEAVREVTGEVMNRAQSAALLSLLRLDHELGWHSRFHAACPACHEALAPSLDRVLATWAAWRSARTEPCG